MTQLCPLETIIPNFACLIADFSQDHTLYIGLCDQIELLYLLGLQRIKDKLKPDFQILLQYELISTRPI